MNGPRPIAARALLLAAVLAALAGCRSAPSAPPILAVEARDCTAEPVTPGARPLPLSDPAPGGAVAVGDEGEPLSLTVGGKSRCLELGEAGRSLYEVVELPAADRRFVVRVAAEPSGAGLFAPHLLLLGEDGRTLRAVERESFLFRGRRLTVQFWARPEERYLVVASDPEQVGSTIQRITGRTDTMVGVTPTATFIVGRGDEETSHLTYSHGGTVTLVARPVTAAGSQ